MSWTSLPAELRLRTLQYVIETCSSEPTSSARSLAGYAAVSPEWQFFFENKTFSRLVLDLSSLPSFSEAVAGKKSSRLNYIRHLWLRIKLDTYDCSACRQPENITTAARNNLVFAKSILDLLKILSRANGNVRGSGLTLELSVLSPSDTKHVYRDFRLEDDYPFNTEDSLRDKEKYDDYHLTRIADTREIRDRHHGFWRRGRPRYRRRPVLDDKRRLRGTWPLALGTRVLRDPPGESRLVGAALPVVELVKGLVIHRLNYRHISVQTLSRLISESFQGLEMFRNEQYLAMDSELASRSAEDYQKFLFPSLPSTLKSLHIFQAYNPLLCHRHYAPEPLTQTNFSKTSQADCSAKPPLAKALVKSSYQLEQLSVMAKRVDAATLFWDFRAGHVIEFGLPRDHHWPKLRYLLLQTSFLQPRGDPRNVRGLLQAAAVAASRMPLLETLELWYSDERSAALFRYSMKDGIPTFTWRSTWSYTCASTGLPRDPMSIESWEKTARDGRNGQRDLVVDIKPLQLNPEELQKSHGDCIFPYLELRGLLLDPVSLRQVQWESEFRSPL